ncbi:unnamed protein product [Calypogeia fissa]
MSFWPRLRRRSRGRKRSASKSSNSNNNNPYSSSRDIDEYKVVHEELQAQRADFASEKGVSIELVRFLSRSSRGWVHLPSPSEETPSSGTTPRPSQDGEVTPILLTPYASEEFSLPPPAVPLPSHGAPDEVQSRDREEGGRSSQQRGAESSAESSSVSSSVESTVGMGLDRRGDSRNVCRLVVSRKFKDEAWMQIRKTAAVLYVKVLVFSRALGASTAFAFTVAIFVDIWNRGKGTFHRVFSALATQLLTRLKPYLFLQLLNNNNKPASTLIRAPQAPTPAAPQPSSGETEEFPASDAMKVSPVSEDSSAQDLRSSSFAFPVLVKEASTSSSPRFPVNPRLADSQLQQVGSPSEEASSSSPSPLAESNKLPSTRPCHKLKSKLFKCSPARKGENFSPSAAESSQSNGGQSSGALSSSASSSGNVSPARGKSSSKKKASSSSCVSGSAIIGSEEEYDEVDQPTSSSSSSLKPPKKVTRSHELLFFRSPNANRRKEMMMAVSKEISVSSSTSSALPSTSGMRNLSRSQELKFSLKNLGRKKVSRSQEFTPSSPPLPLQHLALPKSTVEGLEALAFPFKIAEEKPSLPSSPRQSSSFATRKKSGLSKSLSVEPTYEKHGTTKGMESPRSSTASAGGSSKGGKSKSTAASSSSMCLSSSKASSSAMLAAAELKPKLKKVKTAVSIPAGSSKLHNDLRRVKTAVISSSNHHPVTSQIAAGELGRSQVLSREILGSILLLSILASLLLGRIPAILCTSCICLILSHIQRLLHKHLTPKDMELLKRSSGMSRLHHASSSSPNLPSSGYSSSGSPLHEKFGLQSSEYRKRVVIEGLLDRGNRRGGMS